MRRRSRSGTWPWEHLRAGVAQTGLVEGPLDAGGALNGSVRPRALLGDPIRALSPPPEPRLLGASPIRWPSRRNVMTTVKPIPDGYHTVTSVLMVNDAAKLIDFLKRAFGAREKERFTDPTGRIVHAEVTLGDSIVQLSDAMGEWKTVQVPLLLYVTDTDATYRRALKAGATSLREPMDAFNGDRTAGVKDSFGNSWWIATHQEDVSREELDKHAEAEMKE